MEKSGSLVSQTAKWDVGSQRTSSLMGLGVGTRCDVLQVSQIAERGPVSCLGLGDSAPFPNLWIFFLSFFFVCVCGFLVIFFWFVCLFCFVFVLSTPSSPVGIRNVGIPFRLLCFPPSEGGRRSWWTGQRVPPEEGMLAQTLTEGYVPPVLWPTAISDFQHFNKHTAFRLCLISQTVLPPPCFIDSFPHCLCSELAAGFVSFL